MLEHFYVINPVCPVVLYCMISFPYQHREYVEHPHKIHIQHQVTYVVYILCSSWMVNGCQIDPYKSRFVCGSRARTCHNVISVCLCFVLFFCPPLREHLDLAGRLLQVPLGGACLIRRASYLLHFFSAANYCSYVPSIHSQRFINPWRKNSSNSESITVCKWTFIQHFSAFSVTFMFFSLNLSVGFLFLGRTKWVPEYS